MNITGLKKILTLSILSVSIFLTSSGCLTNIIDCPEDSLETSSCPTNEAKERERLLILLLILF